MIRRRACRSKQRLPLTLILSPHGGARRRVRVPSPLSSKGEGQGEGCKNYTPAIRGTAASASASFSGCLPPACARSGRPPPPPPQVTTPTRSLSDRLSELKAICFDYDKSDIRADAQTALTQDAATLKTIFADFPDASVTIEGNCDERGSAEYNLGLGDRRASAAKEFLQQLGVSADRLKTVSYGKERPVCTESNETCWQKNRHVHFSPGQ